MSEQNNEDSNNFGLSVQDFKTEDGDVETGGFDTQDADISYDMKPNTTDMAIAYLIDYLTKPSPTTSKVHRNFVAFAPVIEQFEQNQNEFAGLVQSLPMQECHQRIDY